MYIPGSRVLMFPEWPVLKARFISCCYHCLPGVSKLEQVLRRAVHEGQVSNVHLIRAELGKVRWETTPGRQWGLFRSAGSGNVGDKSSHPVPSSLWLHYHSFTHVTTAARVPGFTPQWLLGQPSPSCGSWVLAMFFLLLFLYFQITVGDPLNQDHYHGFWPLVSFHWHRLWWGLRLTAMDLPCATACCVLVPVADFLLQVWRGCFIPKFGAPFSFDTLKFTPDMTLEIESFLTF